jgi:hypothetical protein
MQEISARKPTFEEIYNEAVKDAEEKLGRELGRERFYLKEDFKK